VHQDFAHASSVRFRDAPCSLQTVCLQGELLREWKAQAFHSHAEGAEGRRRWWWSWWYRGGDGKGAKKLTFEIVTFESWAGPREGVAG
jgi:hypothetical protein